MPDKFRFSPNLLNSNVSDKFIRTTVTSFKGENNSDDSAEENFAQTTPGKIIERLYKMDITANPNSLLSTPHTHNNETVNTPNELETTNEAKTEEGELLSIITSDTPEIDDGVYYDYFLQEYSKLNIGCEVDIDTIRQNDKKLQIIPALYRHKDNKDVQDNLPNLLTLINDKLGSDAKFDKEAYNSSISSEILSPDIDPTEKGDNDLNLLLLLSKNGITPESFNEIYSNIINCGYASFYELLSSYKKITQDNGVNPKLYSTFPEIIYECLRRKENNQENDGITLENFQLLCKDKNLGSIFNSTKSIIDYKSKAENKRAADNKLDLLEFLDIIRFLPNSNYFKRKPSIVLNELTLARDIYKSNINALSQYINEHASADNSFVKNVKTPFELFNKYFRNIYHQQVEIDKGSFDINSLKNLSNAFAAAQILNVSITECDERHDKIAERLIDLCKTEEEIPLYFKKHKDTLLNNADDKFFDAITLMKCEPEECTPLLKNTVTSFKPLFKSYEKLIPKFINCVMPLIDSDENNRTILIKMLYTLKNKCSDEDYGAFLKKLSKSEFYSIPDIDTSKKSNKAHTNSLYLIDEMFECKESEYDDNFVNFIKCAHKNNIPTIYDFADNTLKLIKQIQIVNLPKNASDINLYPVIQKSKNTHVVNSEIELKKCFRTGVSRYLKHLLKTPVRFENDLRYLNTFYSAMKNLSVNGKLLPYNELFSPSPLPEISMKDIYEEADKLSGQINTNFYSLLLTADSSQLKKIMDFINNPEVWKIKNSIDYPKISKHARLRIIERYLLADKIDKVDYQAANQIFDKLKNFTDIYKAENLDLINSIYDKYNIDDIFNADSEKYINNILFKVYSDIAEGKYSVVEDENNSNSIEMVFTPPSGRKNLKVMFDTEKPVKMSTFICDKI